VNNLLWLVRREVWENRSLWIAPLVIAGVILIVAAFGGIHVDGKDAFWVGTGDDQRLPAIDVDLDKRRMIYGITISVFSMIQLFVLAIVVFFYLLDSLLNERKDKSILFWKSLPLSDTEVVTSKMLTALVLAPAFVLVVSGVTQLLFALVWSLRFGGTQLGNILMPWDGSVWMNVQAAFWLLAPATIVWYLPIAAYLLLVSVWARKNAFLWAVLPPVALLAIEGMLMQSHHVADFVGRRLSGVFEIVNFEPSPNITADTALAEVVRHVGRVFIHPETWFGLLAAAAMIFAVIRIRRYRDDN